MSGHRVLRVAVLAACLAAGSAAPALAWKLTPEATATERALADN